MKESSPSAASQLQQQQPSTSSGSAMEDDTEEVDAIEAVALSSTFPVAATGSLNGKLLIWDLNSEKLRHDPVRLEGGITRLAWRGGAGGSDLLFCSSLDGSASVWDGRTGSVVRKWTGHRGQVLDMAVAPMGNFLLTAAGDGTVRTFALNEWSFSRVLYLTRALFLVHPHCDTFMRHLHLVDSITGLLSPDFSFNQYRAEVLSVKQSWTFDSSILRRILNSLPNQTKLFPDILLNYMRAFSFDWFSWFSCQYTTLRIWKRRSVPSTSLAISLLSLICRSYNRLFVPPCSICVQLLLSIWRTKQNFSERTL